MTSTSIRRSVVRLVLLAGILALPHAAWAACGDGVLNAGEDCDDASQNGSVNSCCTSSCTLSGESPDVIVGDITTPDRYGTLNGITAYAIGTTSCNIGNCWLNWISSTPDHPVIGQNMFRLKEGRFEHIGQAWLKHGFTALTGNVCATCNPPPNGSRLGVNCSDPYVASLNGSQTRLGPKQDVNPNSGIFPYPDARINTTGDVLFKRLQVKNSDLDPTLNAGAQYFLEGQYVTRDDAEAKNNTNNASYRTVNVGVSPNFSLTLTGSTQRMKAGIQAWKVADPLVTETSIGAEGLFILAAKATSLGNGLWHYEYALQNFTSQRAGQSFTVPIPTGTVVSNVGFHDVDYHSGEPFSLVDWTPTVTATSVSWATQTYATNQNANALRWGTLYNFRFDANVPPGTGAITLGLFRPGSPTSVNNTTVVPGPCTSLPSGAACSDGNPCTQSDSCSSGACLGSNPVVCSASDQCHDAGTCNINTGACSNPPKANGSACDDVNACTLSDTCQTGTCQGANPVTCTASDQCHVAGLCNPGDGSCSNPTVANGTLCDDGDTCTVSDACTAGACAGVGDPGPGLVDDGVVLEQIEGVTTITWNPAPGSGWSGVLRGLFSALPVGPGGDDEVCLDDHAMGSSIQDAANPDPDSGFWYLVRGKSTCGTGSYGSESQNGISSVPRESTTCP